MQMEYSVCKTTAFADVSHLITDIYWTQAKMLLLADVDEYGFENAGICIIDILAYSWIQSPISDFICTTSAGLFVGIMTYF